MTLSLRFVNAFEINPVEMFELVQLVSNENGSTVFKAIVESQIFEGYEKHYFEGNVLVIEYQKFSFVFVVVDEILEVREVKINSTPERSQTFHSVMEQLNGYEINEERLQLIESFIEFIAFCNDELLKEREVATVIQELIFKDIATIQGSIENGIPVIS